MSPRRKEQKAPALEVTARDFAMARLAAARSCAQSVTSAIDEALILFLDPDEDDDGAERVQMIEDALDLAGSCARALESAHEVMPLVDPEECEPWDEDGEEVDDEPEDLPRARVARGGD